MANSLQLWRDRRGRVSVLRIATLCLLLLPIALLLWSLWTVGPDPRQVNNLIHRSGYWALIFLVSSLAITPFRNVARFGQLVDVRRMMGVGAFCYAITHFSLYIVDQQFDLGKVVGEIVSRLYLTIGFTALIGLAILAATSTDGMARRLGPRRWRRLHQASYVIAVLGLVHFFQQTKSDVSVPTLVAGLFGWLMMYRLVAAMRRKNNELSSWELVAVTIAAALLTFAGETFGIGIAYHVSPWRVAQGAFDFRYTIQPYWIVLVAGLAVAIIDAARARWHKPRRVRPPESVVAAGSRAQQAVSRQPS